MCVYAEAGIMVQMVLQQQDSLMKMELMYMLCLLVHRRELMNTGFRNQLSVILELTVLNMMAILIFLIPFLIASCTCSLGVPEPP